MLRYRILLLALMAGILTAGAWSYRAVDKSLRDARGETLRTLLSLQSEALERWIQEFADRAQQLAELDGVRRSAADAAWSAPPAGGAGADSPAERLGRSIAAHFGSVESEETGKSTVVVASRDGRVLYSTADQPAGARLPARELDRLAPSFGGRPGFIAPFRLDRPQAPPVLSAGAPTVWSVAPLRAEDDRIVAVLCLGYPAEQEFARTLLAARSGQTGEAYVFDAQGTLLSQSRFGKRLAQLGALDSETRSAMLAVRLAQSTSAGEPSGSEAVLTQLAARATERRYAVDAADREGLVLEPYPGYHGADTVGAWRWLSRHDIGLAVEMSADEAYGALRYLESGLTAIVVLLGIGWFALFVSPGKLLKSFGGGAPRQVGPYRIVRQIGEGSISNVYLAHHQLLSRPAAVKVLKPQSSTDEWIARFEREVQLASQLTHPNTISIFDYGRGQGGLFYYAMEYLEGLSMSDLVERYGPLPSARAAYLLRQVCDSLGEAHAAGLIHRDIKPQNIMVCELRGQRDVVKVLDFGLVKRIGGEQSRDLTRSLKILGTPLYMSPERIHNPADVGPATDIYSIGAVGFYLLTGKRLFETDNDHDLTYHILHVIPRRVSELAAAEVPPELDDLLARCLAKDLGSRPTSTAELGEALDRILAEHPWTKRQIDAWWRENWVPADSPLRRLPGA